MPFPKEFVWGTATASYQVEGAAREDGRGECIWTRFSHTPGKVYQGHTGDVACDQYHRYREDVALMQDLGLQAYRFSISWPRVLPHGMGVPNTAGLDYYDRLVNALLSANIQPFATLYHWDLPQSLQDRGGWANPDSVKWFADYTDLITRRLGDRVRNWITHNEPWVVAFMGHWSGRHAPGIRDLPTAFRVAHHLLLSHGAAVPVIRRNAPNAQVGITLDVHRYEPATPATQDVEATVRQDGVHHRLFLDPVFRGHYPADLLEHFDGIYRNIDVSAIGRAAEPIDFLGLNYYMRFLFAHDEEPPFFSRAVPNEGVQHTEMGWEVYPEGLTRNLVRLHRDYKIPAIYITENGAAFDDPAPQDGMVDDPDRVAYYDAHIDAVEQALEQGVPVRGYFAWSLIDNFEWAYGYSKRFGIIHVDHETQQRTLKRSALYYKQRIADSRASAR